MALKGRGPFVKYMARLGLLSRCLRREELEDDKSIVADFVKIVNNFRFLLTNFVYCEKMALLS